MRDKRKAPCVRRTWPRLPATSPGKTDNASNAPLARGRADHRKANAKRLRWRYLWFRLACLALLADTILWLVSIGVR